MTWIKLDDNFADHQKILSVSDRALRLHINALCWAARSMSDGEIPATVLPALRGTAKIAAELAGAGLWDTTSRGGWAIHDYLEYNPSREALEADRAEARARMANVRANKPRTSGEVREKFALPRPDPSRPVPDPDPDPAVPIGTDSGALAPPAEKKQRKRLIAEADIARWTRDNPEVDIAAMVADYLNWTGSSGHHDKVQGFENQLRLDFKRNQFRRNGNGRHSVGTTRPAASTAGLAGYD